jgi:signal transduction histidine kinase
MPSQVHPERRRVAARCAGKSGNAMEVCNALQAALLKSIGEPIVAVDKRARVLHVNDAACALVGKKIPCGKPIHKVVRLVDEHGQDLPVKDRPLLRVLRTGKRAESSTISIPKPNGKLVPVVITATPVVFGKKLIGAVVVFRDNSEEKRLDRAKSGFVSLAAHQMRTPLSIIRWYTESLLSEKMGPLTEKQKQTCEEIHRSNLRLIELIQWLLDVSRIETGVYKTPSVSIDTADAANDAVESVEPAAKKKETHIRVHLPSRAMHVWIDKEVFQIIVQNLLLNAIQYSPIGSTISLTMKSHGKDIAIAVRDRGIGVPQKQQSKLFDRFFRADNARHADPNGMGLGLYVVKSLVEANGGKIWFESKLHKGSTFYVSLPKKGNRSKHVSRD